jgi:hypothetical protein
LLREPAEILGRPPEIDNIDRIKGRRFFELLLDRGKCRARHGSRSLDADIDIRALSARPRSPRAEHEDAIDRIEDVAPDHFRGEFGGVGGIADRSHVPSASNPDLN